MAVKEWAAGRTMMTQLTAKLTDKGAHRWVNNNNNNNKMTIGFMLGPFRKVSGHQPRAVLSSHLSA